MSATFTLVEREKLGWPDGQGNGGAYRIATVAPASAETAWDQLRAEIAQFPRRYAPFGTHTLVLLAVTR